MRLKAVLTILEARFAEPDFSAQKLAAAAGLSERYVNELLYEAGASFTMRLTELRLRKAADLLAHAPSAASATSPSTAASTICPISTAASAAVSG